MQSLSLSTRGVRLGDTINAASRLKGINRMFGTSIIASAAMHDATGSEFLMRPLGRVTLLGKTKVCAGRALS